MADIPNPYKNGSEYGDFRAPALDGKIEVLSGTSLRLNWETASAVDLGTEISQLNTVTDSWDVIHTTASGATTYDVTGLTVDTQYSFTIRTKIATGPDEFTTYSAMVSQMTYSSKPTPVNVTKTLLGNTSDNTYILEGGLYEVSDGDHVWVYEEGSIGHNSVGANKPLRMRKASTFDGLRTAPVTTIKDIEVVDATPAPPSTQTIWYDYLASYSIYNNGRLHLFCDKVIKNVTNPPGFKELIGLAYFYSDDDGATWSDEYIIPETELLAKNFASFGAYPGACVIDNDNIRWIFWMATFSTSWNTVFELSTSDNGDNWEFKSNYSVRGSGTVPSQQPNETSAVKLSDGTVLICSRLHQAKYYSFWYDDGTNGWQPLGLCDFDDRTSISGTGLPSQTTNQHPCRMTLIDIDGTPVIQFVHVYRGGQIGGIDQPRAMYVTYIKESDIRSFGTHAIRADAIFKIDDSAANATWIDDQSGYPFVYNPSGDMNMELIFNNEVGNYTHQYFYTISDAHKATVKTLLNIP